MADIIDVVDMDENLFKMFIEEAQEQIEQVEELLIKLEKDKTNTDVINQLFRMIHTIKGSAGTLRVDIMAKLAHSFENLLSKIRANQFTVDDEIMNVFFEAADCITETFREICHNQDVSAENVRVIIELIENSIYKRENLCKELPSQNQSAFNRVQEHIENIFSIKITINQELENKSIILQLLLDSLQEYGKVLSINPADTLSNGNNINKAIEIKFSTTKPQKSLEIELEYLMADGNMIEIIPVKSPDEKPIQKKEAVKKVIEEGKKDDSSNPNKNQKTAKEEKITIRVDTDKIDKIINLIGEFVIDKEAINQIIKELKIKYKGDTLVSNLVHVFSHVNYLSNELQEKVMSVRMLPLENIFNKFPKIARDIASKCNKKVTIKIEGQDTEIDRGIMEELIDPLTHLIRNSIDHGIEYDYERIKLGKKEEGTISLRARYSESNVFIEIEDDGAGLNLEKIKEKALDKKLISELELLVMSDEEIMQFVFLPGFSTAEKVSEISGRGVGLDIVKSNIRKLNGSIDIYSKKGQGTIFTIRLPLTIEIIQALMINEDEFKFAIPIASVIEIIKIKPEEAKGKIHMINDVEVFEWRDKYLPVIRVANYFSINNEDEGKINGDNPGKKILIVIVGHGERKTALIVNKLLGTQEIVIKPMGEFIGKDKLLGDIGGISGESILGDGSFAHIIDVDVMSENWRQIIRQNLRK